ncbi:cation:proton antiporter regulatory subunit [Bacillus sp. SKDU12]|uniref:cation:proton antiporter regulatory subunit n=1 Tax=Bacillus sp. SKDU12 TaxID=1337053 RepID=UPI00138A3B16|nr:hypothetical protein BTW01_06865 [Bacillus sp. SKDU12]
MRIRESELPGIGHKVEIMTRNRDKMSIVIHHDGRRELYYFDENDHEECVASVQFDDVEARQVSAILGGMAYKPKALERVESALDDLIIEWCKAEAGAPAVHHTIGDLDARREYHVTVIAIIKKSQDKQLNPGSETVIDEGDTLVISGESNGLKRLIREKFTANGA